MDEKKITMATIGGHGFGAKVAAATAINNLNRFTGVIQLEGGPLEHKHYEAWHELSGYIQFAATLDLNALDANQVNKALEQNIHCKKWLSIFKQNLNQESGSLHWNFNVEDLAANSKKQSPDVTKWSHAQGLWPGQALALFATNSRWVHLATNTLPFYNVFPRLQGQFPGQINTHGDGLEGPMTHWIHEEPSEEVWHLSQKMWRWLRWHDGANVLLADKSEAGWYFIPDRGQSEGSVIGEYTPEHVHHDYLHTDAYEKSREARGVVGANHGEFLPRDQFSRRQ